MNKAPDFQSMILALHKYWADQGCLIWHPYYSQVGAGTMNPATFLRVLGPEPFNVGYVEPSVRPDDGRYGENPNRLQMFYQYQVILKPDPGNPQELYLGSLEAIGIDPSKHDIRFVEDNWEQPAFGAWGLGWEVWLDGIEITQFTYFQQAGRQDLDPVSVEITYGLDRIAAPLQGVSNFKDIQWNKKHTFGDMNLQGEREHSRYYFEVADVERTRKIYELTEKEVKAALDEGLLMPAYDNLLKLSHLFNVLDSRGAIGVTERQGFFRGMRVLAGKAADLYLEERQRLEYPWLEDEQRDKRANEKGSKKVKSAIKAPEKAAPFLLEIGTEELPPSDLDTYLEQLESLVQALLEKLHLEHGDIRVMGTPRRLVVFVEELAPKQPDREELVKGPPASRAFDGDGKPTKAAEGFAHGKSLSVNDLEVLEIDGGEYVVAKVEEKGRPAVVLLAERFPGLIANLKVGKTMRWNASNVAFSRPIRWLLAMHDTNVIPFKYAGNTSGAETRGLRFIEPETITVKDSTEYFATLKKQGIILNTEKRRASIEKQINKLAKEVKGEIKPDSDLLAEVTHMVEAPTALRGTFEEEFLSLPAEVLVEVMKKHQRYFPVYKNDKLLPYFITLRNGGDQYLDLITRGNEDVIRARFADAAFFVEDDLKQSLEDFLPKLDTLTFQTDLGSMSDKTRRIVSLVDNVAKQLNLTPDETATAKRAAELSKADLASRMVVEITSLQGLMGQLYAQKSGESDDVANAIFEHYLPRFTGDIAPKSKAGLAVGLADKLDSLVGLFAAGLAPTGAKDPFAQRRAARGLVQNLIAWDVDFDLEKAINNAAEKYEPFGVNSQSKTDCLSFIQNRMRNMFLEEGWPHDVVNAVLAKHGHNPASARRAVEQLSKWVEREDWHEILPEYSRCVRITRGHIKQLKVDRKLFTEDAENSLLEALENVEEAVERAPGSVDDFLNAFLPMIPPIKKFFDDVLVMTEDEKVRDNRLGLMWRIYALTNEVADMERLEGF
jgi:glycyl-tRNA synthetase